MFIRGTNSNHTLVMINGVPINDQSSTQGLYDFGVDFCSYYSTDRSLSRIKRN